MARIRTLKPEFFDSPSTAKAGPWARLLFQRMWCEADDHGRGKWTPTGLLAAAFPHEFNIPGNPHGFPVTPGDSRGMFELIGKVQKAFEVVFYTLHGRRYFWIPSWEEHQKIAKPGKSYAPLPNTPECLLDQDIYQDSEGEEMALAAINKHFPGTPGDSRGLHRLETGNRKQETGNGIDDSHLVIESSVHARAISDEVKNKLAEMGIEYPVWLNRLEKAGITLRPDWDMAYVNLAWQVLVKSREPISNATGYLVTALERNPDEIRALAADNDLLLREAS